MLDLKNKTFRKKSLEVPLQNVISPSQKELIEVSSKITRNEREYILVTWMASFPSRNEPFSDKNEEIWFTLWDFIVKVIIRSLMKLMGIRTVTSLKILLKFSGFYLKIMVRSLKVFVELQRSKNPFNSDFIENPRVES